MAEKKEEVRGDDSWYSNLTTADGSGIQFDPLLLEDDADRGRGSEPEDDAVDGASDDGDMMDPYDELGRTPPRQIVARNRKWSSDKKFMRESEKRMRQPRPRGVEYAGRRSFSPKVRLPKKGAKKFLARNLYEDTNIQFDYESDSGGGRFNNGGPVKIKTPHEEEEDDPYKSAQSLGPGAYGLPTSIRQADSVPMVETTNRFISLSSRPVTVQAPAPGPVSSVPNSGCNTPRKKSSIGGKGRQEFFTVLTALYQSSKKLEIDASTRPETSERQVSQEDTIWQNEQKEVIWLELQAWLAGSSVRAQDQTIHAARTSLDTLAAHVTGYRFRPASGLQLESQVSVESTDTSAALDIYYDAQESIESRLSVADISSQLENARISESDNKQIDEDDRQDTLTEDTVDTADGVDESKGKGSQEEESDVICDSLDIWCPQRISQTEKAMMEVEEILNKIDHCEKLFPSSRILVANNEAWRDKEFKARVKVLCVWFNITVQLHKKTEQLGRALVGLGAKLGQNVPWPLLSLLRVPRTEQVMTGVRKESSAGAGTEENISKDVSTDVAESNKKSPVKIVKFQVSEDVASTTSPSDSNNSTDSSAAERHSARLLSARRQDSALSNASLNTSLSSDSGVWTEGQSPYRKYVEKLLKTKGIRKTLQLQHKETKYILHRAKVALEKSTPIMDTDYLSTSGHHDWQGQLVEERLNSSLPQHIQNDEEILKEFGCSHPFFRKMNLPSFRAVYLFLCRVPKDIILECLKIRLEQKPLEPSELSIRQLMRECKEALKIAVNNRQKYITRVRAAIHDLEKDKPFLLSFEEEMEDFDSCLTKTLDVYLEYLKSFVMMIQADSSLLISTYQKNLLEQEWEFVKTTCPHIPGGEARASNTFCQMGCGMLSSIGDFLKMGSDEIIRNMYDISDDIDEEDSSSRKILFEALRGYQSLFVEARERAVKAIAFAKILRKDLEVSAEFGVKGDPHGLLKRLQETRHVKVLAPNCDLQIFVPACISKHQESVLQLLDMHCGQTTGAINKDKGYLVLVDPNVISDKYIWRGETIPIRLKSAETIIALSQIRCLILAKEQRATSQAIADSLDHVKTEALQLRAQICEELNVVEEKCDSNNLDPYDKEALSRRMKEILLQCYKFGFEYHKELDRLITGKQSRQLFCSGVIRFSKQWMNFVLKWCERGRGLKPDWTSKGMDFLMFAANPENTKFIPDEEFENFRILAERVNNHVMGEADSTPDRRQSISPNIDTRPGSGRFSRSNSRPSSPSRSTSREEGTFVRRLSSTLDAGDSAVMPPPQSPISSLPRRRSKTRNSLTSDECDLVQLKVPKFATLPWQERVVQSIEKLEESIEESRRDLLIVGKVLDKAVHEDKIHIKARQVRFSWQRGVKIGQGNFGKVYTAINNETGDIMAMKEIPLQPNDHRTLKSVSDELKIFESIHHPHLVKHFGIEIHREEMLIFMEYCPEGTLETLVSSTEFGLEEVLGRRYTRQLTQAISCLHENGVVHRDIKTANIFLTEEMKTVKLGDFGCAVKIKAATTMPGELQGFVGTQAYMAPEVFTRNMSEGHGRAADIWSLGCVVLEMIQGERPWANIHSNYQIMYKVGMGQSPDVPDELSEEGKNFLECCFVHSPEERATAQDLLSHNFTKVFDEDENNPSIPLFTSVADGSDWRKPLVRKDSGKFSVT